MFYENLTAVCRERGTTPTTALKACGFATGSLGGWKKGKWPNSEIVVALAAIWCISLFFRQNEIISTGRDKDRINN